MSVAEEQLAMQLRAAGIGHEREFRFHPERRWRADFRIGDVLLEVEGGTWIGGRHTRGGGFIADMEKYNAAVMAGWRVLRVTPAMVRNGEALMLVEMATRGG